MNKRWKSGIALVGLLVLLLTLFGCSASYSPANDSTQGEGDYKDTDTNQLWEF
jgi:hypothetical protein